MMAEWARGVEGLDRHKGDSACAVGRARSGAIYGRGEVEVNEYDGDGVVGVFLVSGDADIAPGEVAVHPAFLGNGIDDEIEAAPGAEQVEGGEVLGERFRDVGGHGLAEFARGGVVKIIAGSFVASVIGGESGSCLLPFAVDAGSHQTGRCLRTDLKIAMNFCLP